MVKIREITYKNYGTCVELSNGLVDVCVTADVGPRIIRYGFIGKENMMHEDTARRGCEKGDVFDRFYGTGSAWYSYGRASALGLAGGAAAHILPRQCARGVQNQR